MAIAVEVFDSRRNQLGEGPTATGIGNNHIQWCDIYGQLIRSKDLASGAISEYQVDEAVGFQIPRSNGGDILGRALNPIIETINEGFEFDQRERFLALAARENIKSGKRILDAQEIAAYKKSLKYDEKLTKEEIEGRIAGLGLTSEQDLTSIMAKKPEERMSGLLGHAYNLAQAAGGGQSIFETALEPMKKIMETQEIKVVIELPAGVS